MEQLDLLSVEPSKGPKGSWKKLSRTRSGIEILLRSVRECRERLEKARYGDWTVSISATEAEKLLDQSLEKVRRARLKEKQLEDQVYMMDGSQRGASSTRK